MTNSDSSESCIRLRLSVKHVGKEVVKRVTAKGNEVVEVNGFTFVRKRKPSPEEDAAAQHDNSAKRQLLAAAQEHPEHGAPQGGNQQLLGLNGDVQGGSAAACNGNALQGPACQEGSMEAEAAVHHTGEGDSQVQVQLLPNSDAHAHGAETVAPGAPGVSAAQGSLEPACPASPKQPLILPEVLTTDLSAGAPTAAEDNGLLTAERFGAQLASCLPASCPKLLKLHFVVAQALDTAAAQASTPMRHTAHSLSQAFVELIEQEVAACRQQLVASAMHTAAGLQETGMTGIEQARGEKQQGQQQIEATGGRQTRATAAKNAAAGTEATALATAADAAVDMEATATGAADNVSADMEVQRASGLASLPPLLRDAVTEGSALAISMQQQLAQLEAEEAAWLSLKQAYARSPAAHAPTSSGRAAQGQASAQQHPHQQQPEAAEQEQQQGAGESEEAQVRSDCCNDAQGVPAANSAKGAGTAVSGLQEHPSFCAGAGQEQQQQQHSQEQQQHSQKERSALAGPLLLQAVSSIEAGAGDSNGVATAAAPAAAAGAAEPGEAVARHAAMGAGADRVAAAVAQPLPEEQGAQQGQQQQEEQQQGALTAGGQESGSALMQAVGEETHCSLSRPPPVTQDQSASVKEGQGGRQEGSGSGGAEGVRASQSDACVRALKEARAQAGARLMMQVELLASRLARVDLLVGRAEQVANSMQADYHQDRFRTFPHVNSPAWLIRRLTQAKPPAWLGADAAVA